MATGKAAPFSVSFCNNSANFVLERDNLASSAIVFARIGAASVHRLKKREARAGDRVKLVTN
jgi:hypothetical protein